jgi:predicted dehydrogenase
MGTDGPVMLRVGVVGVGFGREVHVPAFRADERCRVVAIGAASAGRAREAAAALGVEQAFGDWQDLVTSPDLDVVTIAVPPAVQPAVAEAAARAGKHIFCEKPAGATIPPVERMVAAAVASRVAHGIDFFFPELDAWRKAKAAVEDGTLGPSSGTSRPSPIARDATPGSFATTWVEERSTTSPVTACTISNGSSAGSGASRPV